MSDAINREAVERVTLHMLNVLKREATALSGLPEHNRIDVPALILGTATLVREMLDQLEKIDELLALDTVKEVLSILMGHYMNKFHENQFFKPVDEREHEQGARGYNVPDYCLLCRHPFLDHFNGRCPIDEEDN